MAAQKSPFELIYSNDCTNILNCVSPFRGRGEEFRYVTTFRANAEDFHPRVVEATEDGVAGTGFDASLLSLGSGWVPW